MSDSLINTYQVVGAKADIPFEADGVTPIPPSTLANQTAEDNKGHNPDFFPSTGESKEQENEIGKGANPSADIVTKNTTTIDPVHGATPETNDGVTTVDSVPAVLPAGAPITEPSGDVHPAQG